MEISAEAISSRTQSLKPLQVSLILVVHAAVDIAAVSCYGASFMERFTPLYPEVARMQAHLQFYTGTYALQETLHGIGEQGSGCF